MENGAFSAGPADSAAPATPQTAPPLEMKAQRPAEEKQPLCQCDAQCACLEAGAPAAGRAASVQVQAWSRAKTVVLAGGLVALAAWCAVMAVMHHYGVL